MAFSLSRSLLLILSSLSESLQHSPPLHHLHPPTAQLYSCWWVCLGLNYGCSTAALRDCTANTLMHEHTHSLPWPPELLWLLFRGVERCPFLGINCTVYEQVPEDPRYVSLASFYSSSSPSPPLLWSPCPRRRLTKCKKVCHYITTIHLFLILFISFPP